MCKVRSCVFTTQLQSLITDKPSYQVPLEAMVSSTDLVTTRTAFRLWLTIHRVKLYSAPEGISHKEEATMLLSRQLASNGVQTGPKAGVNSWHELQTMICCSNLAYTNRKPCAHTALSMAKQQDYACSVISHLTLLVYPLLSCDIRHIELQEAFKDVCQRPAHR